MSLEDETSDVIAKAMRGLALDPAALALSSGVSEDHITALLQGEIDQAAIIAICPALGLDATALLHLPNYSPQENHLPYIRRIELPFGQWIVNAWKIKHESTQLLFDTGFRATDILSAVTTPSLDAALITHSHPDHIGGRGALEEKGVKVISEQVALAENTLHFGKLRIEVLDLSGHCSPAVGYLIHGLERQIFISGDAIFAGSMGGCKSREAYKLAANTLRSAFARLDPTCIILPGHGPATTAAEELLHNPFLPLFR